MTTLVDYSLGKVRSGLDLPRASFSNRTPDGRQSTITDLRTQTAGNTVYTYNDADQIVAVTTVDPDAAPGSNGPLTAQTTRFTYDSMGRQTRIEQPDGTLQHREYNYRGQLAKSYGTTGYPVQYTYDTQGRRKTLITWKDFNQDTGTPGIGVSGKATTTWHYNPYRGFLDSKIYDDGKGTAYTYTNAGRLQTRTWQRGVTTTYAYDPAGQLLSVDYSDTTQDIAYVYDRLGRRQSTIDAAGLTSYAYLDGANNLVTSMTVTPGSTVSGTPGSSDTLTGTQLSYAYDAQLRRQSVTASRLVNSVMTSYHTTGYTYDAASRLSTVTDGTNFATYNYLANSGNMIDNVVYAVDTNLTDGQQLPTTNMFTTTKTYDQLGRFVSHQSVRTSDSAVLSSYGYTYNKQGQRAQAQMTDGSYWDYQYDPLGQLSGAAKFAPGGGGKILPGYQYNYQYDQIGNRTKVSTGGDPFGLNQRDTTYQSNTLNQYTQINNHPYVSVLGQSQQDATVTVQLDNTQPIKSGSTQQTTAGTFIAQTTRTAIPNTTDAAFYAELEVDTGSGAGGTSGGRAELDLAVTGVRNAQGPNGEDAIDTKTITRQTPALLVTPTYDDDGNLLSDDRWTYVYNGENRLVELIPQPVYHADSQILMKRLTFIYDSTGRRIEKRVYSYNTVTLQHDTLEAVTRYVYDGWLLIVELTPAAIVANEPTGDLSPLRTYTSGLDISGTPEGAGGIAGLLFTRTINPTSDDDVYAYCYDGNGNVTDLINIPTPTAITAGTQVEVNATYEYSPFGQLIRVTGAAADANLFRFSTKYTDAETGFCYYGYRYYDSVWGRWLNRDPIEEDGGVNVYGHSINNPNNNYDVLGLSLITLDVPATQTKCQLALQWISMMAKGSTIGLLTTTNSLLWHHYLYGNGAPMTLDMSRFDRFSATRNGIARDIWEMENNSIKLGIQNLPCSQRKMLFSGYGTWQGLALPSYMILNYQMKANYLIQAKKNVVKKVAVRGFLYV